MGYNKDGKYRLNIYLNPTDIRDKVIIDYLENRYSASDYIKEMIFTLANGSSIEGAVASKVNLVNEVAVDEVEIEVDEIVGLENIEI